MRAWLKIRRNQLLVGAGALVVLAGAFFLLHRGSSSQPIAFPSTAPGGVTASPTPSASPGRRTPQLVVFTGRDPFQATSDFAPYAQADSGGATPTPSPSTLSFVQTIGPTSTVGGQTVTLISVSGTHVARLRINGKAYSVVPGETFFRRFQLSSISGSCARMLYGDQSFTLCTA